MKRYIASFIAVLGAVVALSLSGGVASASAASCSATGAGGEKAPALVNGGAGIHESAQGGYNCTVGWYALVSPQYESGGTWHTSIDAGGPYPKHGNFAANTGHNWTDGEKDPQSGNPDFPACSVNWRFSVDLFNSSNDNNIQSTVSPQLAKTC